ncbi:hypothetical protein AQS8620_03197 [Aquimixticola soesokkakensis]|uniref:Uncharacterized protein n=1 Tax=Aquimixticola soesokkakensis TaxID=1519096 RepID=A0A1Y5TNZ0_9RHOB|nr:hypothetical protein [Aquimixticola soesokkakensis]SLN68132.1 hypothetical protein AQS8620_03197 [Aquimixticola soesokkakensis]
MANETYVREGRSNGGLYFILGAVVVVLGVVVYLLVGNDSGISMPASDGGSVTINNNDAPTPSPDVSITNEAPAAPEAAPAQ